MKKNITKNILLTILGLSIFAICALFVSYYITKTGNYPKGSDVYGHLFKSNVLYNAIQDGVLYPTYTPLWYNGVDLFRYWPPASYYIIAFLMFFTNGNVLTAFSWFIALIFFVGASGWLLFGIREQRMGLSIAIGLIFFFLPDNMRVFFSEGNVPRIVITALLPYLFFFLLEFVKYKKKLAIIPIILFTCAIIFSHIMISAMVGVSVFLLLLMYSITNKEFKASIIAICGMLLSYLMMGIILIPSLIGGIVSQDSSSSTSTSASWSQDILKTINPTLHISNMDLFYFGLSLFLIILLGIIVCRKNTMPFFITSLLILFSTSTAMVHLIMLLPLSQVFWMQRFIPMACVICLIGVLYWKNCKKITTIVFLIAIVIDCTTMSAFIKNNDIENENNQYVENVQNQLATEYMLDKAETLTQNRVALLDLSNYGSFPSYYFSRNLMNGEATNYLYGWAYQGAYTVSEIVQINESFENGYFYFTFDRLIELGSDVVVIKKDELNNILDEDYEKNYNEIIKAANANNFTLYGETNSAMLFKLSLDENITSFGTKTKYDYLAVGTSSYYISYIYPDFKVGNSDYIDDYNYNELASYSKIYLSGFKYHNKEVAENLLTRLSDNGIQVYIDMNNIPIDELSGKNEFLNVYAQFISFTDMFPIIEMNNGSQFKLQMSTKDYDEWYCVYLTGIPANAKKSDYGNGTNLTYYGTSKNENIHYIGFNLLYYCVSDKNEKLLDFLNETFDIQDGILPIREIVPIDVQVDYDKIVINSTEDDVNTNLSHLEGLTSSNVIDEEHHLIKVSSGTTILEIEYPHFKLGLMVSIIGLIGTFLFAIYLYTTKISTKVKMNEEKLSN